MLEVSSCVCLTPVCGADAPHPVILPHPEISTLSTMNAGRGSPRSGCVRGHTQHSRAVPYGPFLVIISLIIVFGRSPPYSNITIPIIQQSTASAESAPHNLYSASLLLRWLLILFRDKLLLFVTYMYLQEIYICPACYKLTRMSESNRISILKS